MPNHQQPSRLGEHEARGRRAEAVATWYFRLNGFLSIPGFIVHVDRPRATGQHDAARTEADLIAVRFPFSRETVGGRQMTDDPLLNFSGQGMPSKGPTFLLSEVKAGRCAMNGPWREPQSANMQRVIRRLGFVETEEQVEEVAQAMYSHARWENNTMLMQYVCVGKQKDPHLTARFDHLVQIDWQDIGAFLHKRFSEFPEKLPSGRVHHQWPKFGKEYGRWFCNQGRQASPAEATNAVSNFIEFGTLERR